MLGILLFFTILVLLSGWALRSAARRRERALVLARPFPDTWRTILERNMPLYRRLRSEQRERLEHLVKGFVHDIPFEGCGGVTIDDEIRVTVAAQACLLQLGRKGRRFPLLRAILVYPSTYHVRAEDHQGETLRDTRLGESWGQGYVVLAWDAVLHGAADFRDGHNLVLHEFAHQLDQEDTSGGDGIPLSADDPTMRYGQWAWVLERDFEEHVERSSRGEPSTLDPYGATNEAEFFAVATEAFFEKPGALRRSHPELYQLLEEFYGVQPGTWTDT